MNNGAWPPGPKGRWLTGSLEDFAADRLAFLDGLHQQYGDVASFRLVRRRMVLLSHPDHIEELLVTRNRHFIKHFALRMTKRTLGNGLLTSTGDFWRRQRKLAQPAFHRDRVSRHAAVMVDFTRRMMAEWADGQTRDVQQDMMRLTLEIVAKTLFGADVAEKSREASEAMECLLHAFTARVNRMIRLPDWVPTPVNVRVERAARRLDRLIYDFIAARRKSGVAGDDLLSLLLHAHDEDGGMTDQQLRDELMTLFMAGHETTANTLSWVWYLLATHPEAEARLHEELDHVLGGRAPTADDVPNLRYTEAVINESLRLYPTVWLIGREAVEPCEIAGYRIPPGTTVYASQWVVHRDPRWYGDPLAYRPERWAQLDQEAAHRYAFFPFGGGPRICIGNGFSMMESVLLLSTMAQRFRLKLAPDADVRPLPTMTLRPKFGVKVVLAERTAAAADSASR